MLNYHDSLEDGGQSTKSSHDSSSFEIFKKGKKISSNNTHF